MSRSSGPGFTLVEVLVALALVGAALLPAVVHMRRMLSKDTALADEMRAAIEARRRPPLVGLPESAAPAEN